MRSFIGVCQSIAICPGISCSGATMVGGLLSRFNRPHAVRYALPDFYSVGSRSVYHGTAVCCRCGVLGAGHRYGVMIAGIAVAAVSGYAAIKVMIKAVTNEKLFYFSIYTWIAGLFPDRLFHICRNGLRIQRHR